MGPEIMYATQSIDPTEIRVYKGANGSFTLYEDEGDTYNYEKGSYSVIPFSYNEASKVLTIGSRTGSYQNMPENRIFNIVWVAENYGTGINVPFVCDTTVQYVGNQVIIHFRTPTGIHNPKNDQTRCTVYPNPATATVIINFNAETSGKAEIKLIDYTGKCIYMNTIDAMTGTNAYTLNMKQNNIGSGAYFATVSCGKDQYTRKIVLK